MSLRGKFIVYLVIIHLVFGACAYLLLHERRIWLLAVEAFFVLSFVVGLRLIRGLFEPITLIRAGVDFINASDFATRIREVGQPELDPLIHVYNRMAEHLREERIRSQEQEQFLQRMISVSPTGVLALDLDCRISLVNPSAEALLGRARKDIIGQRLEDLGNPFARKLSGLEQERPQLLGLRGRRRVRCQALHFMDRGFARRFILMDEMTEELHRTEKAAYEKLIRMLSHEVNNTAGAVGSLLESCFNYRNQLQPADQDDFTEALSVAISRTGHMNRFMQEFAAVVRLPAPRKRPSEVQGLLRDVVMLVSAQSRDSRIEWVWDVQGRLQPVDLDPTQMEQAFLNILRNAVEAVGEEGTITLRLGLEGDRPYVAIQDDGGGIPPEIQQHLFTPFFTSKENGQGIGLTLVQEILLGHGFDFTLENAGEGVTEFKILF